MQFFKIINATNKLLSHEGPVWQVSWAHPKFGILLASASYDGRVIIWKEQDAPVQSHNIPNMQAPHGQTKTNWVRVKEHRSHEGSSVNSISWAPHEYGLHLACGSSDGRISVISYIPGDDAGATHASWSVSDWAAHQIGCNAVSFAPHNVEGGSFRLASGGSDNNVKIWTRTAQNNELASRDNLVSRDTGDWVLECVLPQMHTDWVKDVTWAPAGCPETLVSCSQDRSVLVWRQKSTTSSNVHGSGSTEWVATPLTKDPPFMETLWRVSFSTHGSLLAVASGDNRVSLWREEVDGSFVLVSDNDQASL